MAYKQPGAILLPKMEKKGPFSVEVPGVERVDGETIPRRNTRCKDGLITRPDPSVETIYDIVQYSARKFGNARCIGTRTLIDTVKEKKMVKKVVDGKETEVEKEWTFFQLSSFKFMSFIEFKQHISTLGAGFKKMGLAKGDRIHLYGATSMNWMSMAQGAFTQSLTIVTAYDTLGLEGLRSSLKQTKSKAIFLDSGLLSTLNKALKDAPAINHIILNNESKPNEDDLNRLTSEYPNIRLTLYEDLKKLGGENPTEHVVPGAEDLACIMYTSGSSGTPKGVTIKHKAVVASIAGVSAIVGDYIHPDDHLLAYLPQAHILEFMLENACIFWGSTLGYGSLKTLTDASVRKCRGDLAEFRPSILIGVPAVWETIRKGIVSKVDSGGIITRNLFWGAFSAKQSLMATGVPGAKVLDTVVFNKVRTATGGRLRLCLSAGGPLAKDTQIFISMVIAPLVSGYGLTETSGSGALNDPLAWTADAHGDIPCAIEEKLVDFAEAGYYTSNNPPQGELWIRGPPVTEGYYENEEETKLAIRDDGWFMTGDIAEFDKNGHVKIIDRKKNLVKTLNGEYIALEKLESVYRASALVANICVYAAEDKNKPIAIIVPAERALVELASSNGIQGHGLEDLVGNDKLNELVLRELQRAGRQGQLSGIELIDGIVMDKDEWTAQNGFITAAQKIQRKKILEKNKKNVMKAYGKS